MEANAAKELVELAIEKGVMLATAESCTGGMIAAAITDIAGSSAAFDRSFVTYSNEAKAEMLGVDEGVIKQKGAVSETVARAMVAGVLANSRATTAVSVTGIAGPGGGTMEKPVGLVFIAVQSQDGVATVRRCTFADQGAQTRAEIRELTVTTALEMLRAEIS